MAGRPLSDKANTRAIRKLNKMSDVVDLRPIVAYVMHHSGCTWAEISRTFGVNRQTAESIVKELESKL